MKLPHWLVISMLSSSALAALAAVGWWWVTWPERTAMAFCDAMEKADWSTVNSVILCPEFVPIVDMEGNFGDTLKRPLKLQGMPQSLLDLVISRRSFRIAEEYDFEVQRGRVQMNGLELIVLRWAIEYQEETYHSP